MEVPKIDIIPDLKGCVYKLFWGEKYVVIKCKTFLRSKTIMEQSLGYFLKRNHPDKHYTPFFEYIKSHPFYKFSTEVLYQHNNPYRLLIFEQLELENSQPDVNCLNISFDAYIPVNIQGKRKTWITRGHYLNFMHWLKKHKEKRLS